MKRRRRNPLGFSLIEVSVASALLLTGLTASLIGSMSALDQQAHQRWVTMGVQVAESAVEELLLAHKGSTLFNGGTTWHYDVVGRRVSAASAYRVTWSVTPCPWPVNEVEHLVVYVAWDEEHGPRSVSLETDRY